MHALASETCCKHMHAKPQAKLYVRGHILHLGLKSNSTGSSFDRILQHLYAESLSIFNLLVRIHETLDRTAVSTDPGKLIGWQIRVVESDSGWHNALHGHSRTAEVR